MVMYAEKLGSIPQYRHVGGTGWRWQLMMFVSAPTCKVMQQHFKKKNGKI